jgi:hypothetical protein
MGPTERARLFLALSLSLAACTAPQTAPEVAALAAPLAAPEVRATPEQVVQRVIEIGRTNSTVDEYLRALCQDIGPRLTGSTNAQKACEWSRDEFAKLGLDARLERWGEYPVGFDRGPWRGGMVAPEKLDFEFNTMAWTPGTNGPKRGAALKYPATQQELDAIADQIAGKWLVRPPSAELKDAAGNVVFAKPAQPSSELVEKVGKLIVEKGGLGEVRGSRNELLITDGRWEIKWDELPKLVQVRVRRDQHDQLWSRLFKDEAVELEFDVDNRFVQGPRPTYNVVADLRGSSKPDEYVIVCGHIDSWDGAQGTVDNGTGCATTLEAARLLVRAGARPERTIRFCLWTGEEQGLFGSKGYVRDHASELPAISAVLNHDGGTNYLSGLRGSDEMVAQLKQACAPLLGLDPAMPFEIRGGDGMQAQADSDHWPFYAAGVPGFFWDQAGRSDYNHHHHTQFDTLDGAIPEYQRHSSMVAAITAFNLANLPELLDRTNMKAPDPRRMGVRLEGTKVTNVMEGRGKKAGLLVGDVVEAVDGRDVKTQALLHSELQRGEPRKTLRVTRGEEVLEIVVDWSDDPEEPKRAARAQQKAGKDAARKAEKKAAASEAKAGASEPVKSERP